jgi:DNA-binding helix-hairpin-helix protein with protein kinase domain
MLAFSPPVHSIWATCLPAASAELATLCASSTAVGSLPGLVPLPWNANDAELVNGCRTSKKVLFVLPCVPGQAPVAMVYQPCPVFGGKPCSSPLAPVAPWAMSAW